ncbi:histone H1-like [Cryptomeria japonica]|uniref:histone H1-like n=1 Tax=Cryptomeria japonica TaxID=3369 RepID=UPI0025AD6066|nr:histone H1-like [Cryptomeria japonica]
MGITREAVQEAREKNILKEEDVVKPQAKPSPPKNPKAKPRKLAPTSTMQKLVPPPKSKPAASIDGAKIRKKEKSTRQYIETKEETKLDEDHVRQVKKTATHEMVVWKPTSRYAPPAKKAKSQGEPSEKVKVDKKEKSEIDEALKCDKIESPYEIGPPLTL